MEPEDTYRPPASQSEPSPVPGMSRGEFEELAENLRWFGSLSLAEQLRAIRRHQREWRLWQRRVPPVGDGR